MEIIKMLASFLGAGGVSGMHSTVGGRDIDLSALASTARKAQIGQFRSSVALGLILAGGGIGVDELFGGGYRAGDPVGNVELILTVIIGVGVGAWVILRGYQRVRRVPVRLSIEPSSIRITFLDGYSRTLPIADPTQRIDLWHWDFAAENWIPFQIRVKEGDWQPLTEQAFEALLAEFAERGLTELPRPNGWNDPDSGELRAFVANPSPTEARVG